MMAGYTCKTPSRGKQTLISVFTLSLSALGRLHRCAFTAEHDSGFPEAINAQTRSGVRRSDFNHLSIEHVSALCTTLSPSLTFISGRGYGLPSSSLRRAVFSSTTLMSIGLSVIRGEVRSLILATLCRLLTCPCLDRQQSII